MLSSSLLPVDHTQDHPLSSGPPGKLLSPKSKHSPKMPTARGGPPRARQRTRQPPAFRGRRHRQDRTTDVHTTAERPGPWCPQGAGSQGAVSSAPAAPLSAAALRSDGPRPLAVEKRALVSGCPGPRGGRVTLCWPVTRRSVRGGFGEGARAERPRLGPLRPRPTPPPAAASPEPGISFSDVEKRASSRVKQDSKPLDARPAGTRAAAWALERSRPPRADIRGPPP